MYLGTHSSAYTLQVRMLKGCALSKGEWQVIFLEGPGALGQEGKRRLAPQYQGLEGSEGEKLIARDQCCGTGR